LRQAVLGQVRTRQLSDDLAAAHDEDAVADVRQVGILDRGDQRCRTGFRRPLDDLEDLLP
jgi:hypothetical protein